MIRQKHLLAIFVIAWTLLLASCGFLETKTEAQMLQETADEFIRQLEGFEETAQQFAILTNSALPTIVPIQTYEATITRRPTLRFTKTLIPTSTITTTPSPTSPAKAYVSGDTNCRTGPSKSYDWVTLIHAGQSVDIIGRDTSDQYWVIRNPNGDGVCWLWKALATQTISSGRVPILASPPTKTPTRTASNTPKPRFSIKLEQVILCQGQESLVIRVYNSYSLPYRSWRAKVYNLPGNITQAIVAADQFSNDIDECILSISSLPVRGTGYAIVPFDADLATDFLVEFEACTLAGKHGACAFDGFTFNVQFLTATPTTTPTPTKTPTKTPTPTNTPTTPSP